MCMSARTEFATRHRADSVPHAAATATASASGANTGTNGGAESAKATLMAAINSPRLTGFWNYAAAPQAEAAARMSSST